MQDYLAIANSWPVWLCAFAAVAVVVVQSVIFARLCFKNAGLAGLTRGDCTKSFRSGMITAVGPSLSCFIGAISMIVVVGGPLSWMRLSMIGAASTELFAASNGAAAYGVEMGGAGFDINVMATTWLVMALNGCGWMVATVLLNPRMESIRQKVGGGDETWLSLITWAATIGVTCYMASPYYLSLFDAPPMAWAGIAGTVIMIICEKLSKQFKWLGDFGMGFAIIGGIIVGYILQ